MINLASLAALSPADRFAILKADIDALTKELEKARAEILATGSDRVVGTNVIVEVSLSERSSLDTKAVKALLSPEQISACTKTSDVHTLRVKARTATVLA